MNTCILESPEDKFFQEDLDELANRLSVYTELKGRSVLVTGATGLVGSVLIKALACLNRKYDMGMTLLPFVRNEKKAESVYGGLLTRGDLRLVKGDILEPIETEEHVDYIIHCASVTASKTFVTKPVETLHISIDGTENVLKFAHGCHVKSMVYISSMEAFGITDPKKASVKEEDLGYIDVMNVRSCYSEGKRVCELLCASYCHEYKVPVKVVRLAQTFGAGVSVSEGRVFAQFAKSAIKEEDIVLHTAGQSWGNYCYTADAAAGIMTALLRGENANVYTAANPETSVQIRDMAKMVAEKMADGKINVVFDIPEDAMTYGYAPDVVLHLNSDKLQTLGWKPQYNLEEMYRRLIASFIAQGMTKEA